MSADEPGAGAAREIEIAELGARGDGVAPGPLYAPLTLPGERVGGAVAGDRMRAPRILRASPERVSPPCPHFGVCGGCALQHGSDAFLAGWKRDRIAAALAARGLSAEIEETAASPPGSRRRVVLAAKRVKSGALLGFHGRGDARIVPVETCPVAAPEIVAAFSALRALAARLGSRKGEMTLTVALSLGGLDVALTGAKPLDREARAEAAALAGEAGWARLTVDGEPVAAFGPAAQRFGAITVEPPPGGFLQATREGEAALCETVEAAVRGARRVVDLFAGSGTFAGRLARGASVSAIEADPAAVAALSRGARASAPPHPIKATARDLFRRPLTPAELAGFDAAVIDPPRAGAAAQTVALAHSTIARIAAVSCDPATFARDARTLVDAGWRLAGVRPVDQFRWSPHVELAAAFERD